MNFRIRRKRAEFHSPLNAHDIQLLTVYSVYYMRKGEKLTCNEKKQGQSSWSYSTILEENDS